MEPLALKLLPLSTMGIKDLMMDVASFRRASKSQILKMWLCTTLSRNGSGDTRSEGPVQGCDAGGLCACPFLGCISKLRKYAQLTHNEGNVPSSPLCWEDRNEASFPSFKSAKEGDLRAP